MCRRHVDEALHKSVKTKRRIISPNVVKLSREIRFWMGQALFRDLVVKRRAIVYLVLVLAGVVYGAIFLVTLVYVDDSPVALKSFTSAVVAAGVVTSGAIVDRSHDKVHFTFVLLATSAAGVALVPLTPPVCTYLGVLFLGFSTPLLLVTWTSVVIHETTTLNRGRVLALVATFGLVYGLVVLFFVNDPPLMRLGFLPLLALAVAVYGYSFVYFVYDSKEVLETSLRFRQVFVDRNLLGYSLAVGFLAAAVSLLLPRFRVEEDLLTFLVAIVVVVLAAGVLIDNIGRKPTLAIGSTSFVVLLVFFQDRHATAFAVIYGVITAVMVMLVITISGDFTIEKARAFRSRVVGVFFTSLFVGFAGGYGLANYFEETGAEPDLCFRVAQLFVFLEVAALLIVQESLARKDTEWYRHLRQMYVFHTSSGICLFDHDFRKDLPSDALPGARVTATPSKDLVSGGLAGIVALISEITQSQTPLRAVDHGDSTIVFHYGRYTTIALITGRYLRTHLLKLRAFGREFEDIFESFLRDFRGDVTAFDAAEYLVEKYFQPKYLGLRAFYK
ncbi:MAG: hypothetical protein Kow0069_12290 [Promethearchaeota archaeon]